MFSNDNDYKIINKHGFFGVKKNNNLISNAKLDSEKTIVFIRTINDENQETQLSKNSSFEIVQYNIKENTEKIIYSYKL